MIQSIISIDVGTRHLAVLKLGVDDITLQCFVMCFRLIDLEALAEVKKKSNNHGITLHAALTPFLYVQEDEVIRSVVIEQQFGFGGNANNKMKCMSHRIHQFFLDWFFFHPNAKDSTHTKFDVSFMSAKSKFTMKALPSHVHCVDKNELVTKPKRKKYSIWLTEQYMLDDVSKECWNDERRQEFQELCHATNKSKDKRDDISDVFLQALVAKERCGF